MVLDVYPDARPRLTEGLATYGCPQAALASISSEAACSTASTVMVATSVRAIKGPQRPYMPLDERAEIIGALRCVDAVTWFDEPDLVATLRELRPDVHAKGSDYTPQTVPEASVDAELGIEIAICGDPKDRSTTKLLARIGGP